MTMFSTFRRTDGYVRFDTPWYGFGYHGKWCIGPEGCHRRWWLNSYRRAPIHITWLTAVMWFTKPQIKRVALTFDGSRVEPYASWTLRIGRFGVSGRSPRWLVRFKHRQAAKEMKLYAESYPDYIDEMEG